MDDRPPRDRRSQVALGVVLVALALVVGRDGTLGWQVVRVAVVGALGVGSFALLRRSPGWAIAVRIAWGVIGLVLGVAIGIRHVLADASSLTAIVCVLATVAGIVLVAIGIAALLRRVGMPWGLAVAPVSVLSVLVLVWVAVPAVVVTNVPDTQVGDESPADRGIDHTDVTFLAADGTRISAWYVPSRDGAAVVLRHGAGSTRSGVLDELVVLAANGYGVLATDARGHGDSSGRAMDFGWYGDVDIDAAVTFLAAQDGVDPDRIGLVGSSMGGEEAIGAAAADERVRAVVAEGATARTAADKDWYSEEYGVRGALQERLEWLQYGLTDLLTEADPPRSLADAVARAAPTPVLLIAAGDVEEEVSTAEVLRARSPDTVTTWTVDGAGHTEGLEVAPGEWEARVVEFLADALGAT